MRTIFFINIIYGATMLGCEQNIQLIWLALSPMIGGKHPNV
jgi:hypothetical protein